ncbi:hypothetical protein CHCC14427_3489 [Bacillus paralicheniformis]|nr:hypothetical protein CHCC14427_3489 [Bacillus paralicheniformis]
MLAGSSKSIPALNFPGKENKPVVRKGPIFVGTPITAPSGIG